jgi:nickel/cobalt transporter (NicO) family protein
LPEILQRYMTNQLLYFSGLAASLGFIHTILGPDHYVPFIFMAKARHWSTRRTLFITAFCGLGHVLSSVAIGFAGIALGSGISKLTQIEGVRGNWAAWGFTIFGLIYMLWGFYRAYQRKPHKHTHLHEGEVHEHVHVHEIEHDHLHNAEKLTNITPWVLFVIFVLGPCEPLIPVIIYPALEKSGSIFQALVVSGIFSVITIATMLLLVFLLQKGISFIRLRNFERYTHALAGAILLLSGIAILFLGL